MKLPVKRNPHTKENNNCSGYRETAGGLEQKVFKNIHFLMFNYIQYLIHIIVVRVHKSLGEVQKNLFRCIIGVNTQL